MKLSEAIRLGSMLVPQARNVFVGRLVVTPSGAECIGIQSGPQKDPPGEPVGACALGAAWLADNDIFLKWNVDSEALHPITRSTQPFFAIVTSLNDDFGWSREQIADWVATVEAPIAVAREAPVDVQPAAL